MTSLLVLLIAGIVIFVALIIGVYNTLIHKRMSVKEAWADIDVQLKRRYDLIPNIVESVKGYASHEKELFEKVTLARSQAMQATGKEKMLAENTLTETIKSLFAVAENYPQLKANENFLGLQQELSDTENKIESSRRFYNGTVKEYNISVQVFPSNIIAGLFGFKPEPLFETTKPEEREAVKVKF